MSTVLKERDLQLEYKVKRMLAEKLAEKEEILKMRQNHLKDIDRARQEEEETHKKRYDFADDIRAEIEKRAHERNSNGNVPMINQNELENYRKEAQQIREEFKQKKIDVAQKKIEDAKRIRNSLAKQIEEKRNNKIEEEKNALDFELSNQRFNNMKNMFAEKRKEFTTNQAMNRIKISEHISSWNIKAQQETEQAENKFLEAIGRANNQKGKLEEEKKQKQREQFKKEQEQFLSLHVLLV
jgi:hypothetical protein